MTAHVPEAFSLIAAGANEDTLIEALHKALEERWGRRNSPIGTCQHVSLLASW